MTFPDLVNSNCLELPLERSDLDFPDFIKQYLNNYIDVLNQIDGEYAALIKERIPIVKTCSDILIKSIEEYYLGNTVKSYNLFANAAKNLKEYLPIQRVVTDVFQRFGGKDYYYKSRVSFISYSKEKMFIRPFECREEIPTYRYSIPGLPCLYLSKHIITNWCELGCPDVNSLQSSAFDIDISLKKLFFSKSIYNFRILFNASQYYDELLQYITYFPLHAICTIKVKKPISIFRPEYIFPQFLMQWIKQEDIDIVEYMSTQLDYSQFRGSSTHIEFSNLAIPAKTSKYEGVCDVLKSKIKLTEPISWQRLNSSFPTLDIPQTDIHKNLSMQEMLSNTTLIELIKGQKVQYNKTVFGIMEDFLRNQMTTSLLQ